MQLRETENSEPAPPAPPVNEINVATVVGSATCDGGNVIYIEDDEGRMEYAMAPLQVFDCPAAPSSPPTASPRTSPALESAPIVPYAAGLSQAPKATSVPAAAAATTLTCFDLRVSSSHSKIADANQHFVSITDSENSSSVPTGAKLESAAAVPSPPRIMTPSDDVPTSISTVGPSESLGNSSSMSDEDHRNGFDTFRQRYAKSGIDDPPVSLCDSVSINTAGFHSTTTRASATTLEESRNTLNAVPSPSPDQMIADGGVPPQLDTQQRMTGPTVDPEVEQEMDAESIASSGSDGEGGSSSSDVPNEHRYFRFNRAGLRIEIPLKNTPETEVSSEGLILDPPSQCTIMDFEDLCRAKYEPNLVGGEADRFADAPGTSIEALKLHASNIAEKFPGAPVAARSNNIAGTEDRLTAVIADILHRINRQGVLADPHHVCRKGGGKAGDFYEADESFFDDSLANELLGYDADARIPEVGSDANSSDEEYDSDGHEFNKRLVLIAYADGSKFAFDRNLERDCEPLFDEELVSSGEEAESDTESVDFDADQDVEFTGPAKPVLVPGIPFRPRAWRRLWPSEESSSLVVVRGVLEKFEMQAGEFGNREGLFVEKSTVKAELCRLTQLIAKSVFPALLPLQEVQNEVDNELRARRNEEVERNKLICERPIESIGVDSTGPSTSSSEGPFDQVAASAGVDTSAELHSHAAQSKERCVSYGKGKSQPPKGGKKKATFVSKKKYLTEKDLLPPEWSHLDILAACLSKICSVVQEKDIKRWFESSIVLHNQLVYNVLEDRLIRYILHRSPLFRKKTSNFFRNLKREVNDFLAAAAAKKRDERNIKESKGTDKLLPGSAGPDNSTLIAANEMNQTGPTENGESKEEAESAVLKEGTGLKEGGLTGPKESGHTGPKEGGLTGPKESGLIGRKEGGLPGPKEGGHAGPKESGLTGPKEGGLTGPKEGGLTGPKEGGLTGPKEGKEGGSKDDASSSAFFPVAAELINWAVLYNCRRHELRKILTDSDEFPEDWTSSHSGYIGDRINISIIRRRLGAEAARKVEIARRFTEIDNLWSKNERIYTPVKFTESTFKRFRAYFNVPTLYERRALKRVGPPTFVYPCKGLVAVSRGKPAEKRLGGDLQIAKQEPRSRVREPLTKQVRLTVSSTNPTANAADNAVSKGERVEGSDNTKPFVDRHLAGTETSPKKEGLLVKPPSTPPRLSKLMTGSAPSEPKESQPLSGKSRSGSSPTPSGTKYATSQSQDSLTHSRGSKTPSLNTRYQLQRETDSFPIFSPSLPQLYATSYQTEVMQQAQLSNLMHLWLLNGSRAHQELSANGLSQQQSPTRGTVPFDSHPAMLSVNQGQKNISERTIRKRQRNGPDGKAATPPSASGFKKNEKRRKQESSTTRNATGTPSVETLEESQLGYSGRLTLEQNSQLQNASPVLPQPSQSGPLSVASDVGALAAGNPAPLESETILRESSSASVRSTFPPTEEKPAALPVQNNTVG